MLLAIKWAREQKVPYLGICLGFQLAVIEWGRHVCGYTGKQAYLLILSHHMTGLRRGDVDGVH